MQSTRAVNELLVRQFLRDFTADHLHDIVHALNEHTQHVSLSQTCEDLYENPVEDLTGVQALARFLYGQAVDWGDPSYRQLESYLHDDAARPR